MNYREARTMKDRLAAEFAQAGVNVHSIGITNRAGQARVNVVCDDLPSARTARYIGAALCDGAIDIEVLRRFQLK